MTDILAFGAHPDDLEFGCGGILAKMASQGKKIVLVDITLGDKGTNGTPEIRRQESLEAAKVIGAPRVFLDFKDCEVFDTYEGRLKLVRVIREYKPKLVLGPLWKGEQNHPDHLALGIMLRHACRYARFRNVLPELPAHKVEGILHYLNISWEPIDFLVDVSDQVEIWKKMMACHESQHQTNPFTDLVLRMASKNGISIRCQYAQGLVKGNPIEIDDIMTIAKGSREL
jgi:bacillithiol biosynthesis deacetylase BshB1